MRLRMEIISIPWIVMQYKRRLLFLTSLYKRYNFVISIDKRVNTEQIV